ncbi:UDP-glycosyltransferase UGT4-like [Coccinella septempunctata]|uniref:UDP-glycosyltransferase UGT4-like n=1 Tax=Coccinella septempunctata TaxID=41139 RepID=UPI001D05CF0E|nr:UDP-glycosyltransferase UGT4-like [Coccinella septempunctata]
MRLVFSITLFLCACEFVTCANIFAVIPSPFYSHQATFRPLWRELAKKGHKITLITTDLMEANENITQIDYHGCYEVFEKNSFGNLLKKGLKVLDALLMFKDLMRATLDYQFSQPQLVEMLKNNRTFDLMMVELAQPGWPLLSYKFKCPYIGLTSMDTYSTLHAAVGNAVHPAIYPSADFGFQEELSFKDRLLSTFLTVLGEMVFRFFFTPFTDNYLKTVIGDDLPTSEETFKNMSMLFVNANPIFFPIRPVTPVTVNLGGGLHLTHQKKLPEVRFLKNKILCYFMP